VIAACVATRNEPTIALFVRDLHRYVDGVIVCDESNDGGVTQWEAHAAGAAVVACSGGIGPSLMRGWQCALDGGADRILQIDAGGSHSAADIPKLLAASTDVVVGSRFVFGGTYVNRQWRAGASRVYAHAMDRRSGEHVADWTSGYRAFTGEAAKVLGEHEYRASMHGWQAEVLLRAFDAGFDVSEVPISYRAGMSSLKPRHVWEAVRVR
jgi:dolichol-phosphate mannosyltransferase